MLPDAEAVMEPDGEMEDSVPEQHDMQLESPPAAKSSNVDSRPHQVKAPPSFKARPLDKAVLESSGDLGVPPAVKRSPTVVKEFNLSKRPSKSNKGIEGEIQHPSSPRRIRVGAATTESQSPKQQGRGRKAAQKASPTVGGTKLPSIKPSPIRVAPNHMA